MPVAITVSMTGRAMVEKRLNARASAVTALRALGTGRGCAGWRPSGCRGARRRGAVACCRRHFGAAETDHQEGGQGAEPDAGHDDVQGVGQYGQEGQVFGGGVAGQGAHGERGGSDGGAQDVLPSCRRGECGYRGRWRRRERRRRRALPRRAPCGYSARVASQACGCQALASMPVAWAVVVARMPSNPSQEDEREPGQRPLQAGHPGGVDGAGNGQEDAASDQDHVGRKL